MGTFMGFRRQDGRVGIRNYIAVIPSVFCANYTAQIIAEQLDGAVALRHPVGCGQVGYDFELTARTLIAMGCHPNVGAVIVVGLGCERFSPDELYEGIWRTGKPAARFVIQEEGGTENTIKRAVEKGREFEKTIKACKRDVCSISELTIALKCGGTDATSGLAANPSVGEVSDRVIAQGGSAILSELNELLGTEDILVKRAVNSQVGDKIYAAVKEIESVLRNGCDLRYPGRNELISPGNFAGGVSSIVEKALGGVHKSGSSPIVDVLQYAEPPEEGKKGLFLMDYESHDGEVVTGMIGCGAQVVLFTTGRGNPTGHPLAPVIKITGNDYTYENMKDNFDYNAGAIITKGVPVEETGNELYELTMQVINGERLTSAERVGADELFCIARRQGGISCWNV